MSRDDFKIFIKPDKENRTLTITDNGIGMDKDELENNLGTISKAQDGDPTHRKYEPVPGEHPELHRGCPAHLRRGPGD